MFYEHYKTLTRSDELVIFAEGGWRFFLHPPFFVGSVGWERKLKVFHAHKNRTTIINSVSLYDKTLLIKKGENSSFSLCSFNTDITNY